MNDIFAGKARLVALAALLSISTLSMAQTAKPLPTDGFDKVEADGASLALPTQAFKALTADKSFHGALTRWTTEMGWHLSWELDSDYSFGYEARFDDDFMKAIDGVCANLNSSGVSARAVVYEGNKVIRIVAEGAKR